MITTGSSIKQFLLFIRFGIITSWTDHQLIEIHDQFEAKTLWEKRNILRQAKALHQRIKSFFFFRPLNLNLLNYFQSR